MTTDFEGDGMPSNRRHFLLMLAAAPVLAACASSFETPGPTYWYGSPPKAAYYEDYIKEYFATVLKDPESARYRFGSPRRAYMNNGLIHGGGIGWAGYAIVVGINAKNSYGGYTGEQPYVLLLQPSGKVLRHLQGDSPLFHWVDS